MSIVEEAYKAMETFCGYSGLNYFGFSVAGSTLWKAHYGMGFKQQLLMMTRAHIISWGHGFLRLRKAQT
ncbi:hypothetical protein HanOQP8_Chr12g0460761 [Helianthus annuus]|nr:hypothetical protein HanOQP8_Chr12g0460761 [Helianthus annuus]